jgi:hypothetical protein
VRFSFHFLSTLLFGLVPPSLHLIFSSTHPLLLFPIFISAKTQIDTKAYHLTTSFLGVVSITSSFNVDEFERLVANVWIVAFSVVVS